MGLKKSYLSFIESSIEHTFGNNVSGLRMLELGDQVIMEPNITEKTGKEYFTNHGYEHVSVDINGLHGSVARDLTKPEQFHDWHNSWDILTNSGTTEHVQPFEAQYDCFGIIHDCLKVGGIAVHLIPDVDERDERNAWKNHCRYYYSGSFFDLLAKECEYELVSNTVINGLRCATVRKTKNAPFMKDRSKFLAEIAQRDHQPDNAVTTIIKRMGVVKILRRLGLR
jgi:hypothetical protein